MYISKHIYSIHAICIIYIFYVISLYSNSPIWEERRKIVTGKRSLQRAAKLDAKGKRKLHFVLYMSENQRFTSPGVLTGGRGPKERIKHHEVSVL